MDTSKRLAGAVARKSLLPDNVLQIEAVHQPLLRSRQEASLFALLEILWRRKLVVIAVVLLGTTATTYFMQSSRPIYRASALVQLDPRQKQLADFNAVVSNLTPEAAVVRSEVTTISSTAIAERVVDQLSLMDDPEFNPHLNAESSASAATGHILASWIDFLPVEMGDIRAFLRRTFHFGESANDPEQLRTLVIDHLLSRISAKNDDRSYSIVIEGSSYDPAKAARIANAFGYAYLEYRTGLNRDLTERVSQWLGARVAEAREAVRASEKDIHDFRENNGLLKVSPSGRSLIQQQTDSLNLELSQTQAQRAVAEARVQQVRGIADTNSVAATPEVLASPLIQKLQEAEAVQQRLLAERQQVYGDKHHEVINLRRGISDLQSRIRTEVNKVLKGLEAEVEVARLREGMLQTRLDDLQHQQARIERVGMKLQDLEREAEARRSLFRSLAERYEQTMALKNTVPFDAMVSAPALVPNQPAFPRIKVSLGVGLIGSTIGAIGLALLLEKRNSGLRTPSEVEGTTGVRCFGMVPSLRGGGRGRRLFGSGTSRAKADAAFRESIQSVRTTACLALRGTGSPQVILVTSSVPKEGKSVLAASLSRSFAKMGSKTLLIDCDLRRPSIATLLGFKPSGSVADVLNGDSDVESLLHHELPNLDVIGNRTRNANAHDCINSISMHELIQWARNNYDVVIIDSAPVMLFSDALSLSFLADSVLYVVRWQHTPRETVTAGLGKLQTLGNFAGGVVLSRVDAARHQKYGHKDEAYYYALHTRA